MKSELQEFFNFLKQLFKKPLQTMSRLPSWDSQKTVKFLALITCTSGILSGLLARSISNLIVGALLLPFVAGFLILVASLLISRLMPILFSKEISQEHIFKIITISSVPFFLFRIIAAELPPIHLIGFASFCILFTVGMVENYQVPKHKMMKIMGAIFGIYFLYWATLLATSYSKSHSKHIEITSESRQLLEKEFSNP